MKVSVVFGKRLFDIIVSMIALSLFSWLIFLAWLLSSIETRSNGFFFQKRIGRYGKPFNIIKIKTMRPSSSNSSSVTTSKDSRITRLGRFWRKTKIDELPQLINVLKGDMSFVGPRPDVPGYADKLKGADRAILSIRPGITGPASIAFKHEEEILSKQIDAQRYNDEVIYPQKVKLNLKYIEEWSLINDIKYIFKTILG